MPPNVLPFLGGAVGGFQGDQRTDPAQNLDMTWDGTGWKSQRVYINDIQSAAAASAWAVSHSIFVVPNDGSQWIVDGPPTVFVNVASTSGTVKLEVALSGVTVGSGTDQTATLATNALTHQVVNGVSVLGPTVMTAGATLNAIWAGTVTNLANAVLTVPIRRIV